jgi:hypothetical protein
MSPPAPPPTTGTLGPPPPPPDTRGVTLAEILVLLEQGETTRALMRAGYPVELVSVAERTRQARGGPVATPPPPHRGAVVTKITPSGIVQRDWFIDPTRGDDLADGKTYGTALQSWAELVRRWGPTPEIHGIGVRVNLVYADMITTPECPLRVTLYGGASLCIYGDVSDDSNGFTRHAAEVRAAGRPPGGAGLPLYWAAGHTVADPTANAPSAMTQTRLTANNSGNFFPLSQVRGQSSQDAALWCAWVLRQEDSNAAPTGPGPLICTRPMKEFPRRRLTVFALGNGCYIAPSTNLDGVVTRQDEGDIPETPENGGPLDGTGTGAATAARGIDGTEPGAPQVGDGTDRLTKRGHKIVNPDGFGGVPNLAGGAPLRLPLSRIQIRAGDHVGGTFYAANLAITDAGTAVADRRVLHIDADPEIYVALWQCRINREARIDRGRVDLVNCWTGPAPAADFPLLFFVGRAAGLNAFGGYFGPSARIAGHLHTTSSCWLGGSIATLNGGYHVLGGSGYGEEDATPDAPTAATPFSARERSCYIGEPASSKNNGNGAALYDTVNLWPGATVSNQGVCMTGDPVAWGRQYINLDGGSTVMLDAYAPAVPKFGPYIDWEFNGNFVNTDAQEATPAIASAQVESLDDGTRSPGIFNLNAGALVSRGQAFRSPLPPALTYPADFVQAAPSGGSGGSGGSGPPMPPGSYNNPNFVANPSLYGAFDPRMIVGCRQWVWVRQVSLANAQFQPDGVTLSSIDDMTGHHDGFGSPNTWYNGVPGQGPTFLTTSDPRAHGQAGLWFDDTLSNFLVGPGFQDLNTSGGHLVIVAAFAATGGTIPDGAPNVLTGFSSFGTSSVEDARSRGSQAASGNDGAWYGSFGAGGAGTTGPGNEPSYLLDTPQIYEEQLCPQGHGLGDAGSPILRKWIDGLTGGGAFIPSIEFLNFFSAIGGSGAHAVPNVGVQCAHLFRGVIWECIIFDHPLDDGERTFLKAGLRTRSQLQYNGLATQDRTFGF